MAAGHKRGCRKDQELCGLLPGTTDLLRHSSGLETLRGGEEWEARICASKQKSQVFSFSVADLLISKDRPIKIHPAPKTETYLVAS